MQGNREWNFLKISFPSSTITNGRTSSWKNFIPVFNFGLLNNNWLTKGAHKQKKYSSGCTQAVKISQQQCHQYTHKPNIFLIHPCIRIISLTMLKQITSFEFSTFLAFSYSSYSSLSLFPCVTHNKESSHHVGWKQKKHRNTSRRRMDVEKLSFFANSSDTVWSYYQEYVQFYLLCSTRQNIFFILFYKRRLYMHIKKLNEHNLGINFFMVLHTHVRRSIMCSRISPYITWNCVAWKSPQEKEKNMKSR